MHDGSGTGIEILGIRPGRVFLIVALMTLVAEVLSSTGIGRGPLALYWNHVLQDRFLVSPPAAVFLLHVLARPKVREVAATLIVALWLGIGLWVWAASRGSGVLLSQIVPLALGGASLVVLGVRTLAARVRCDAEARELLATGAMIASFMPLTLFVLLLTGLLFPFTLDPIVYVADQAFPGPIPLVAMHLVQDRPWLLVVIGFAYVEFPVAVALVHGLERRLQPRPSIGILASFFSVLVVGYSLYLLFPVAGPIYAYRGVFAGSEPVVADLASSWMPVTAVPRNCWPSLHTAWALLVWWHSRPFRPWIRVLAGLFLACTLLATLGMGYHYLVDLVVAYPFALAVRAGRFRLGGVDSPALRRSLWVSGSLVGAWFVLLRVVVPAWPPAHAGVWALTIATIGITAWLRWTTRDAPGPAEPVPPSTAPRSIGCHSPRSRPRRRFRRGPGRVC